MKGLNMKRNIFKSAGAQGITKGARAALRAWGQRKKQAMGPDSIGGNAVGRSPFVFPCFSSLHRCLHLLHCPSPHSTCSPLFTCTWWEMALAAAALWGLSNRATAWFLEFASHFWIVVDSVWWAQPGPVIWGDRGFLTWSVSLQLSGQGVRSWQKWGQQALWSVCCKRIACLRHVDLNWDS